MSPVHLQESRTYDVVLEEAFDRVLVLPLEDLFVRRYGPIPAIRRTEMAAGQVGDWGTLGQTRTIVLADPGTMQETLTVVDRPHRFGYTISDVTGPMKLLVARIEGVWSFDPAGAGTRITWSWLVHPTNVVGRVAMPVFARLWRGYARRSLARLETLLTNPR